jgi:hypothetical protein
VRAEEHGVNKSPIFETSPLERVREGMMVADETGRRLGTVARVRMGDTGAVTAPDQTPGVERVGVAVAPVTSPGGSTSMGEAVPVPAEGQDVPDLPAPLRTELRRVGFVEVDGPGLDGPARYVPGDRVAEVSGDTVRLRAAPTRTAEPLTDVTRPAQPSARAPERSRVWLLVGGGSAAVGLGALIGVWLYRRRQQQQRPLARVRRALADLADSLPEGDRTTAGGLGGGLLLALLLATLLTRARGPEPSSAADAKAVQARAMQQRPGAMRQPGVALGLGLGALGVGLSLWRRPRSHREGPSYIGTPGVESAAGRDRSRTGELPADYGVEHPNR